LFSFYTRFFYWHVTLRINFKAHKKTPQRTYFFNRYFTIKINMGAQKSGRIKPIDLSAQKGAR